MARALALLLAACLAGLPSFARAAASCPDADGAWPARCFGRHGDGLRMHQRFLKHIRFTGDFDNPNPEGIGRFDTVTVDGAGRQTRRCGYFREERFDIVHPARFDHCQAFRDKEALACVGCLRLCDDEDCHSTIFVGGDGFRLGVNGKVSPTRLPTKESVCGRPERFHVDRRHGASPVLRCADADPAPFDTLR